MGLELQGRENLRHLGKKRPFSVSYANFITKLMHNWMVT